MSVEGVSALYESAPPALGIHPAVIGKLSRNAPSSIQSVMNIHVAFGVMHIAYLAVGSSANRGAVLGDMLVAAFRRGTALDRSCVA
jgi:hypothetical protein